MTKIFWTVEQNGKVVATLAGRWEAIAYAQLFGGVVTQAKETSKKGNSANVTSVIPDGCKSQKN